MIIIVDDEENILKSFARILRSEKIEVLTFICPLEAIEAIKKLNVKIVISDFRMQKLNGVEFLQEIKKISPNAKRFILSGYADENLIKNSIENEIVHGYWLKPLDQKQFVDNIKLTLSQ